MYFLPLPLDKVHAQRRKAEAEWNKRNYKNAHTCFENAIAELRDVLNLDVVRNDATVLRTLECQLNDLVRQARHCDVYVDRADSHQPTWEDSGSRAVPTDTSVPLETVRNLHNYDFGSDTLLSGFGVGNSARYAKPMHAGAKKRPKAAGEVLEELRVLVAAKRRDLHNLLQEFRLVEAKMIRSKAELDYFRDRVRIREDGYDLTPRFRTSSRSEDHGRASRSPTAPDPDELCSCSRIEERLNMLEDQPGTLSTLSWAAKRHVGGSDAVTERAALAEELTSLQGDIAEVTRRRVECEQEMDQFDLEIAQFRQKLNEVAPPPMEVSNSDSDSDNCALLPLSLPPEFNLPMPSTSLFLDD